MSFLSANTCKSWMNTAAFGRGLKCTSAALFRSCALSWAFHLKDKKEKKKKMPMPKESRDITEQLSNRNHPGPRRSRRTHSLQQNYFGIFVLQNAEWISCDIAQCLLSSTHISRNVETFWKHLKRECQRGDGGFPCVSAPNCGIPGTGRSHADAEKHIGPGER